MAEPLQEGDIFAGKYRIEKVLGQGGMGMVLAARHLKLDEPVAIKVLLPAMMEMAGMVDRFVREARAAAKIKNEHVVRVTDVDMLPSGVPYMVMDRLEGIDLAGLCKRAGPLPIADAIRYLLETCSAIGEAHAMGIVHRDLKPGNLFLANQRDGSVKIKVLDFGISKMMQSTGEVTMTVAGTVLGSPSYMSPEQIAAVKDIDGRTDLWSLGVILYQLVTGKLPFPGASITELCALVLQTAPRPPRELRADLPPGLEAVILRCLEKDRSRRFGKADELAAALRPFAGGAPSRIVEPMIEEATVPLSLPISESTIALPTTSNSAPIAAAVLIPATNDSAPIAAAVTVGRSPPPQSRAWMVAVAGVILMLVGLGAYLLQSQAQPSTASVTPKETASATAAPVANIAPSLSASAVAPPAATFAAASAEVSAVIPSMTATATVAPAPAPSAPNARPAANTARPAGPAKHYDPGF